MLLKVMINVCKAGSLIQTKHIMESVVQMALMSVTILNPEAWTILRDAWYMGAGRQVLRPCWDHKIEAKA